MNPKLFSLNEQKNHLVNTIKSVEFILDKDTKDEYFKMNINENYTNNIDKIIAAVREIPYINISKIPTKTDPYFKFVFKDKKQIQPKILQTLIEFISLIEYQNGTRFEPNKITLLN